MSISKQIVCWCFFFFVATAPGLRAQEKGPQDAQQSCRNFVQGFYNWWVKGEKTRLSRPAYVLKYKRSAFGPELLRLLREWREAQARDKEDDVGPGFDVFLNSQDPGDRYVVGKITRKGDRYRAEVCGIWDGKKNKKPDVVPELMFSHGRWLFLNFHYETSDPRSESLLILLKTLREGWRKAPC
jgi:hypothetical protein